MSKHTPGPWELQTFDWGVDLLMGTALPDTYSYPYAYRPQHKITLIQGIYPGDGDQYKEAIANAYLIAAAPKMYEALRDIVALLDSQGMYGETGPVREARAALAKVQGDDDE